MTPIGLVIGRMNPPHYGHIDLIRTALSFHSSVFVLLGSVGIHDTDNPLDYAKRKDILTSLFPERMLRIHPIHDIP